MRPSELDVTFALYKLHCTTTEDSGGDEPYMWILGFKVDADTLGPPPPDSIFPSFGVQVFKGPPHFPNVLKHDQKAQAGKAYPILPNLGTRSFRLKPALLPLAGWFPGIAGIVCLLWDQDAFAPATSEAGYNKFKELFGPALSTELTSLINGGYDDTLSRDANGNVMPDPADGRTPQWRLSRLRDAAGRKNAVKAITGKVKDQIINRIKDAIKDEAGWDELLDRDDLLGVNAQVFLGDEFSTIQYFSLTYTDDDADYTVQGHAYGSRVHLARLESIVTNVERQIDRDIGLWRRVCWFDLKLYWAHAFRLRTTTRFELRNLLGEAPTFVRWFLNDTPLADGQGSVTVPFEPVDAYEGPPQDILAPNYLGGPGTLTYHTAGSALEISNAGGDGVFFGKVRVLYAYPGDPSLFPPQPPRPIGELLALGYNQEIEFGVVAVDLEMSDEYNADIRRCKRVTDEIDRKHIALNLGKMKINPGDPPPFKKELLDRVMSAASLANAVGLDEAPQRVPTRSLLKREGS
jgi:hypothetical protein